MDGKKTVRVDGLSKLTKIEELRQRLVEDFDVEPERQRLFVKGKQVRLLQIWSLIQSQLSWLDDCTQVSVHGLILASVAHVTLEDLDWGGGGVNRDVRVTAGRTQIHQLDLGHQTVTMA